MPTKFRIARGTDARIQGLSKNEGQVYFATDTGKIYYDVNSTDRIVMGASGVAIHYGQAPADLEPNPDYANGKFFLLSIQEHLENPDELIAIEDLVFNNDGTFYKVWDKDETTLYCQMICKSRMMKIFQYAFTLPIRFLKNAELSEDAPLLKPTAEDFTEVHVLYVQETPHIPESFSFRSLHSRYTLLKAHGALPETEMRI